MSTGRRDSRPRHFDLRVERVNDVNYGLCLEEINHNHDGAEVSVRMGPREMRRVMDSVFTALRHSKIPRSAIGPHRKKPLRLAEEAGVRLALTFLATAPLKKGERIHEVESGIYSMSTEEAFYWYAKCVGDEGLRARRALRLLLAEE